LFKTQQANSKFLVEHVSGSQPLAVVQFQLSPEPHLPPILQEVAALVLVVCFFDNKAEEDKLITVITTKAISITAVPISAFLNLRFNILNLMYNVY
jgi:hypothetical protein